MKLKFTLNRPGVTAVTNGPGVATLVNKNARKVLDAARVDWLADDQYRASLGMTDAKPTLDGMTAEVYANTPFWHLFEFGSIRNPPLPGAVPRGDRRRSQVRGGPVTVTLLPNMEGLVNAFLAANSDIKALVGDPARVVTVVPKNPSFPLIRTTQFDDVKVTQRPLWVGTFSLQFDCWADNEYDAWRTAATAQAVLAGIEGVHSRGVVNGIRFGGLRNLPDVDYEPAKARRIFTAFITGHPTA